MSDALRDERSVSDALHDAATELDAARETFDDYERAEEVATAYRDVRDVLERWEERATDWDDFEGYVRFREALGEVLAELPEDLPEREAFEAADDALTTTPQNPPSNADFERARELLEPAAAYAEAREELESARERYDRVRSEAEERREELAARAEELAQLESLGEADLDAPVERIREPIEAYDEAAREAFAAFRRDAPAREVLRVVARAERFPLVGFDPVPEELRTYVETNEVGTETIPSLLEFAERSRASLAHDVADPAALKRVVGANRTYLERLDGEALTVGWPPPPAPRLRWLARELVSVLGSFAPTETVAKARALRGVADREAYDRLRRSALARAELGAEERDRVASGAVAEELADVREALADVREALDEHPPR